MNRLFEFHPAEHELIVSRILLQVHQAVDESFPNALPAASTRFAKTAFVGSDEPTLTHIIPADLLRDSLSGDESSRSQTHESMGIGSDKFANDDRVDFDPEPDETTSVKSALQANPIKGALIFILSIVLLGLLGYLVLAE